MKRLVVCCDGTGNQIEKNLSNVLKLYRILRKDESQVVFYDPGIGTIGQHEAWARLRQGVRSFWGLATGQGLDENILDAYSFLMEHYEEGDEIFLFGFSRGAYTVRVLAGFLQMIGLLRPEQKNICDYALAAYKQASQKDDFTLAWHFQRVTAARRVLINFMGVWDTVGSVIVPRPDRFYIPSLLALPYTKTNPSVKAMRHAIAIDEKRRMFRLYPWREPQKYVANPFDKTSPHIAQDIKQVWFAGVHSDVGGGYPETQSGLSKFPLIWMIEEAVQHGLAVSTSMLNHLARGTAREGSAHQYVPPDVMAKPHDSMSGLWPALEWIPKRSARKEWQKKWSLFGLYLPTSEPRPIPDEARIHWSALEKQKRDPTYQPVNLPATYTVEGAAQSEPLAAQ